jgi:hypothetical protein
MAFKAYEIVMSDGKRIKFDADELTSVKKGFASKTLFFLRSGAVNPFYVTRIDEDLTRLGHAAEGFKAEERPLRNIWEDEDSRIKGLKHPQTNDNNRLDTSAALDKKNAPQGK